ncbi:oligosaccharide flippase family protein, partial [Vibrio antiquarius]
MSLASLAIKGAVWNLIDKLINQLGMFIVTIYLATILSPQDFGLIGMVMIFVLISDSLVNSGFSQALIQRSNKVTESELSTVLVTNVVLS